MRRLTFSLLLCVLTGNLYPQIAVSSFFSALNSMPAANRQAAVDSFVTLAVQNGGTPLIENGNAFFMYRGSVSSVLVAGDFNDWGSTTALTNVSSTNLWYYSRPFEPTARIDYKFIINGSTWILDPLNAHTVSGGFGPNSELAMPGYKQPWEITYRAGIPHGTQKTYSVYSTNVGSTYQVVVYTPPGYNPNGTVRYPAAYFHDGSEYISLGSAVNVIENLLDSNLIRPVIGVFVVPNSRDVEYSGTKRTAYRLFFANELVRFIDSLYLTIRDPKSRATIGTSLGGNISGLICYYHPDVFGKCGLHSSAFWVNNYEAMSLFYSSPRKNVDFSAVWGTYESVYQYMRPFRDSMTAKGNVFSWQEYAEGHSWGLWRATTDNMLKQFFPPVSGIFNTKPAPGKKSFITAENYPNPFNGLTTIRYSVPEDSYITVQVFSADGTLTAALSEGYVTRGEYNLRWNAGNAASGVYFVRINAQNNSYVLPVMLLK